MSAPIVFVEGDPLVGWVTLSQARDLNADLDSLEDAHLTALLNAAHVACVTYLTPPNAEVVADAFEATPSRQLAQVMQAKAIYNSTYSGGNDSMGPDGFTVTVFPLDWTVKQLLRPARVIGGFW